MAKLKYEFENEYYKSHRRPLRDYEFGYFHVAAKIMSYVAPLANGLMEFAPTKKLKTPPTTHTTASITQPVRPDTIALNPDSAAPPTQPDTVSAAHENGFGIPPPPSPVTAVATIAAGFTP